MASRISFEPEAVERILAEAAEENIGVREFCERAFKDYQFGLTLIKRNSGRLEFAIPLRAVENPDGVLSEWVVASYRNPPEETNADQLREEWVSSTSVEVHSPAARKTAGRSELRVHEIPQGHHPHRHDQRRPHHHAFCRGLDFHHARPCLARKGLPDVQAVHQSRTARSWASSSFSLSRGVDDGGHHPTGPQGGRCLCRHFSARHRFTDPCALQCLLFPVSRSLRDPHKLFHRIGLRSQRKRLAEKDHRAAFWPAGFPKRL